MNSFQNLKLVLLFSAVKNPLKSNQLVALLPHLQQSERSSINPSLNRRFYLQLGGIRVYDITKLISNEATRKKESVGVGKD